MDNTAREQQRLLIVDDSKVVRITARKILRDHFETVEALDGENAWDILNSEETFSLIISDLSMPKLDGFGLLERIRSSHHPHIRDLPVIVITGANDSEATKERATQAGATDFIGKPFDSVHLLARTQAHASAHNTARTLREETLALEDESAIDPLTRIANEMAFMEHGYQQLAYAVRHNTRLSVFHIELDHFGELYKVHGKDAAASIIQTIATVLTEAIRHEDTAARIGAARFALLLPGLNNNGIQNLANRIRKNISERILKHNGTRIHYTISIGVAATEIRRDTRFDDLLALANRQLLHAISRGGDQIVYAGENHPAPPVQPDMQAAGIDREEFMKKMETWSAGGSYEVEEIEMGPLDIAKHPDKNTPAAAADKGPAVCSNISRATSPGPDQGSPASPNTPDLSLEPAFSTSRAVFTLPEEDADDEAIVIGADSKPSQPAENETTVSDTATSPADTAGKHASSKDTDNAHGEQPVMETAASGKARKGLLIRLLSGMWSLFRRTGKPE